MDKELAWKKNKAGYFSASELHRLMSKSDIWTEENINYLYEVQYARKNGVLLSAPNNRNFRLGRENEPYAIDWLRENFITNGEIRHYDRDFDEKPFIKTDFGYGLSPDADEYVNGEIKSIIEIKSCVGNEERSKIFSPTFPYDKKRIRVWNTHRWQIIGQFIGFAELEKVYLMKYDSIDEDDELDERSVVDASRGIYFPFKREEAGKAIDYAIERLSFANDFLNEGNDPADINEYWKKRCCKRM